MTSITSNCLLAIWPSLPSSGRVGVYRCKESGGWIPGPGASGGPELGNYGGGWVENNSGVLALGSGMASTPDNWFGPLVATSIWWRTH